MRELALAVHADYEALTPRSRQLFERASAVLPGGVSGNLRTHAPYPIYTVEGKGGTILDVDGRAYVDCFQCNGAPFLGHAHPFVVEAVQHAVTRGSLILNPELLIEAAERLRAACPAAESVRFLSTGTEACMTAARLARAITGRRTIAKFRGDYHGQDDQFLVGVGGTDGAVSAGSTPAALQDTILLPFGDPQAAVDLFERADDLAALMLDPVSQAGDGPRLPESQYFKLLRDLCDQHGTLLILDEVITGFRLGRGGAQEALDVVPDLAIYGKAIANGEKIAAVAGAARLMESLAPRAYAFSGVPGVFQSGTYNDGLGALAATVASLDLYEQAERDQSYLRLAAVTQTVVDGMRASFANHGVPFSVTSAGPLVRFDIGNGVLTDLFSLALMTEGVLVPPSSHGRMFFSLAHSDEDATRIVSAFENALRQYPWVSALNEAMEPA